MMFDKNSQINILNPVNFEGTQHGTCLEYSLLDLLNMFVLRVLLLLYSPQNYLSAWCGSVLIFAKMTPNVT